MQVIRNSETLNLTAGNVFKLVHQEHSQINNIIDNACQYVPLSHQKLMQLVKNLHKHLALVDNVFIIALLQPGLIYKQIENV